MDPRQFFFDERLEGGCVYCGNAPDTRDHVPSKVLLDDPLPPDLPVVEACSTCNSGFSLDEEYLACLLDCVFHGSVDLAALRPKVAATLSRKPDLAARIASCRRLDSTGNSIWDPEEDRVRRVVVKLARGHAAYELSATLPEEPEVVQVMPFSVISEDAMAQFENAGAGQLQGWPELGTRAFLRAIVVEEGVYNDGAWVVVQPQRYRYAILEGEVMAVQMVFSEYLACRVVWCQ